MEEENYVLQAKIDLVKIFKNLTDEEKEKIVKLLLIEYSKYITKCLQKKD